VLHRAMELFSTTEFVNAYGLTETSSTIALLGPDDHRAAFSSTDPVAHARLGSVGRLLPGIEVEVRTDDGEALPVGELGLLYFRGEQISGEYAGGTLLDADGWFSSRDRGHLDEDGYLFIEGRADDTIIRGGENIAPAEIEDVLLSCDGIVDAAVVGLPDDEWGQRLVAVVVGSDHASITVEELQETVRQRLRSSKTPETIEFWDELPRTDTGKLLRRQVVAQLSAD
jgi:acyl-CoA synthetase (AMP-forming)/AMP-acid ligase II